MKPRIEDAPFALTSTGAVVLGVAAFKDVDDVEEAVAVARRYGTVIFIGVILDTAESARALERVASGFNEAAAYAAGARQRARRRK
jgi:NAD(P)H-nitrite reductase large subunit